MAVQMIVTHLAAAARRVPRDQRHTLLMTTIFNNSGNYGIPLQRQAFASTGAAGQDAAVALQVFYMLLQNIGNFTLGIFLAAGGRRRAGLRQTLLHVAKFPPLYALAAAFATVLVRSWMSREQVSCAAGVLEPFIQVLTYIEGAFIAVAVCTLGAQLATVRREGPRYPVTLSLVLRLLAGPAIALALIYLSTAAGPLVGWRGITGFHAQLLLIASSTPTAVNCMLLCLEFDNHPDYAARAVFYSTLLSPVTVTLVIFLAQSGLLPGFDA
jgi:predicted permease